jgi:hypothetical protein
MTKQTTVNQNPANYKTQNGLLKALLKISGSEKFGWQENWFLQNAKYVLVEKFDWEETQAARFVAAHMPRVEHIY